VPLPSGQEYSFVPGDAVKNLAQVLRPNRSAISGNDARRLRRKFDPTDKWMKTKGEVEKVSMMREGQPGDRARQLWARSGQVVDRTPNGHQRSGARVCPTGSGHLMNLFEVAQEISDRLTRIFLRNAQGQRPVVCPSRIGLDFRFGYASAGCTDGRGRQWAHNGSSRRPAIARCLCSTIALTCSAAKLRPGQVVSRQVVEIDRTHP
jgi:hypothetical protein